MRRWIKPELWWVIADEPTGKMSYLKAECRNWMDANVIMAKLLKEEPQYRYQLLQIQ